MQQKEWRDRQISPLMQRKSVPRLTGDGSAVTASGLVLTILPPISENNKNTTSIKLGYSFVLEWYGVGPFFLGFSLNVGSMLNEKQLSLSGISNSLTESSKFHKMRTFPRQSKRCMLCQYLSKLSMESISALIIQMSKSFILWCFQLDIFLTKVDRCCNQYSSLVIPSTFYYRPPLLPIIPPCCIRGRWHRQHLRKWKWGVFFFLLNLTLGREHENVFSFENWHWHGMVVSAVGESLIQVSSNSGNPTFGAEMGI